MRLRKMTLALAVLFSVWAFADNFVTITFTDGTTTEKQVNTATETLSFNEAMDSLLFSDGTAYSFAEIDHIGFRYAETEVDPSDDPSVVYITWNGTAAPTIQCSAPGVTAEVNGGDVTLTNTNTDTEYTYVLSGNSTAGSLTLVSDYKSTIKLNGVDLQSDLEEALNIKCGKRVALELVDGTTNTLADCTTDNGQKAALYCKGHLEVSGAGTLNLTGNIKHGISTKEYCQLKKTVGTINILKATGDGIHAGQYFQMNGGNVTISGVGGDGIQAEVTDDETDEDNGQMIIKGGTINVSVTADDVAALQSDSLMTINGGTIIANCTGAADKAFKSDTDIIINDGDITITNSGTGLVDTEATSTDDNTDTAKGISVDNNLYIVGGTVNIKMTGNGGKGIKADNNIYIGDETTQNGPTLSVVTTGSSYSGSSTGGGNSPWGAPANDGWGGGGGPGGGGGNPGGGGGGNPGGESSGSSAKAIKCMNEYYQYGGDIYIETATNGAEGIESKVSSTTSMNFNGGNLFMKVYDDCINSAGQINFNGANIICYSTGNDAIDSNYGRTGAITMKGGTVISFSQAGGVEMGIDTDNTSYVVVSGGTLIAGGGQQGGGGGGWGGGSSSSALGTGSTHNAAWSTTISYTSGYYYSVVCGGKNIITWKMPCAVSSSYNIYASDAFTSSTTHTIYKGTTAPTSGTESNFHNGAGSGSVPMIWMGSDITSGTSAGTFSPN